MPLMDLLLLLLVAGVIGSIGRAIAGFDAGGCLTSIASPPSGPRQGPGSGKPSGPANCSSRSSGRHPAVDADLAGSRLCVASGND